MDLKLKGPLIDLNKWWAI